MPAIEIERPMVVRVVDNRFDEYRATRPIIGQFAHFGLAYRAAVPSVAAMGAPYAIELRLYNGKLTSLPFLAILSGARSVRWTDPFNGMGSGSFTMALTDPNASLISAGHLVRAYIGGVNVFDWWINSPSYRIGSPEGAAGDYVTATGRGIESYLERGVLVGNDLAPRAQTAGTTYTITGNPGAILRNEIAAEQLRGAVPLLSVDFDDTFDSAGASWSPVTITFTSPQQTLLDLVNALRGIGVIVQLDHDFTLRAWRTEVAATYPAGTTGFQQPRLSFQGTPYMTAHTPLPWTIPPAPSVSLGIDWWTSKQGGGAVTYTLGLRRYILTAAGVFQANTLLLTHNVATSADDNTGSTDHWVATFVDTPGTIFLDEIEGYYPAGYALTIEAQGGADIYWQKPILTLTTAGVGTGTHRESTVVLRSGMHLRDAVTWQEPKSRLASDELIAAGSAPSWVSDTTVSAVYGRLEAAFGTAAGSALYTAPTVAAVQDLAARKTEGLSYDVPIIHSAATGHYLAYQDYFPGDYVALDVPPYAVNLAEQVAAITIEGDDAGYVKSTLTLSAVVLTPELRLKDSLALLTGTSA